MVSAAGLRPRRAALALVLACLLSYQAHFLNRLRTDDPASTELNGVLHSARGSDSEERESEISIDGVLVNCLSFLRDVRKGLLPNVVDPNRGLKLDDLQVKTRHPEEPSFWVSLHNRNYDRTRWGIKTNGYYYESDLERIWRSILSEEASQDATVLDVGANIGYFTLLSMAMGGSIVVHAFEPNPISHLRLCESMELNGWSERENAFVYSVGISDQNKRMPFVEARGNPGKSRFVSTSDPEIKSLRNGALREVISLDFLAEKRNWFISRPRIAILKIDVEGQELSVLQGTINLLEAHLIQNVFVEFCVERVPDARATIEILLTNKYQVVGMGGYAGPGRPVRLPRGADLVQHLIDAAANEPSKRLNLWFKLTG
jgi:FkbM family methyltransferase